MKTVIHAEHIAVSTISNMWYVADETAWRAALAFSHRAGVPLLALIYDRLRIVRDMVARAAFERQVSPAVVAAEWLAAMRDANDTECTGAKYAKSGASLQPISTSVEVVSHDD